MGERQGGRAETCWPSVRKGSKSFAQRVTRVDAVERIEVLSLCLYSIEQSHMSLFFTGLTSLAK
jgi:hypothetical protein